MPARRGTYVDLDCYRMDDGRVMVRLNEPGHRLPEEYVPAAEVERLRGIINEAYGHIIHEAREKTIRTLERGVAHD